MATHYSYTKDGNKIKFWTNNDELAEDIAKYIENTLDAIRWRSRVEERKIIEEDKR